MKGLVRRLSAGVLIAAGIVVVGGMLGYRFSAAPMILVGLVIGGLWWLVGAEHSAPHPVEWAAPRHSESRGRFAADITTRRMAQVVQDAEPGRGFTPTVLARTLRERVEERLRRRHGFTVDTPLAEAEGVVSPGLLDFITADPPPSVANRTLRTYLKEIDQL